MKQKLAVTALTLGAAGLAFISGHEGRVYKAYPDPVGVVTICDGHTRTAKMGQTATDAICDYLLQQDTAEAEATVKRLVKVKLTHKQYIALVDFTFNKGSGNFAKSTLLKYINSEQCWAAGAEFPKWRFAKDRELPGLVVRAKHQRELWEGGCST